MKKTIKLEDNPAWRLATELSLWCYELLVELPEEEKYGMQARLRQRAFDLTNDYAEAAGAMDLSTRDYALSLTSRNIASLKSIYYLGTKLGIFELEPERMVKIDKLTEMVAAEAEEVTKAMKAKQISEAVR